MRQAGRFLPEYRELRARHSLLELCHTPELATEVTLQPVTRFGFDAAIVFADILLPFEPLGLGLTFAKGEGPHIERPIRDDQQVRNLPDVQPETALGYVLETIRAVRGALPSSVALIGFAGAPFTLASYAIEGGGTRDFARTKAMMYQSPETWHRLLSRFADLVGRYLAAQAAAGADALQLFDSWVGCLSGADYREFVLPHSRRALELASARPGGGRTPVIHFGTGTAPFLEDFAAAGGDVIGIDWRIEIDEAWRRMNGTAIQGNLDPAALLAPGPRLDARVRDILARAHGRPGHIFNLGHGVLPQTPIESVQRVVEIVHGG
jgi:uroporphyrinogen decarboxylase